MILLDDDDNIKDDNILYNWINASNNHAIDILLFLLSDDIKIYDTIFEYINGKENVKEFLYDLNHIFPNLHMKLISIISYTKKVIAAEIELEGNQFGEFNGNPDLGNSFTIYSVFIFKLNTLGKILKIKINMILDHFLINYKY